MNLPKWLQNFVLIAAVCMPIFSAHAATLTFDDQAAIDASGFHFSDHRLTSYLPDSAYSGTTFLNLGGVESVTVTSKSGADFTANGFWARSLYGTDSLYIAGYGGDNGANMLYVKVVELTQTYQLITLDFRNIKSLVTAYRGWDGMAAADNFTYDEPVGPGAPGPLSPVPETTTYTMIFSGLGLMWLVARRQKHKA
jgi:hypothetical protein